MLKSANKSLYAELEESKRATKELEEKYAEVKKTARALMKEHDKRKREDAASGTDGGGFGVARSDESLAAALANVAALEEECKLLKGATPGPIALNKHVRELEAANTALVAKAQAAKQALQTGHVEVQTLKKTNASLLQDVENSKQALRRERMSGRSEENQQIALLESQIKQQQEVVVALRNENAAIKEDMEEVEDKYAIEHESAKRLSLNLEAAAEALQHQAQEQNGVPGSADMDKLHLRIAELEEQLHNHNDGSAWQRVQVCYSSWSPRLSIYTYISHHPTLYVCLFLVPLPLQAASMTNANLSKQLTALEDTVEQHRRLKKKKDLEWRDRARKYELEVRTCLRVVPCHVLVVYVVVSAPAVGAIPLTLLYTTESTTNSLTDT